MGKVKGRRDLRQEILDKIERSSTPKRDRGIIEF